MIAPNVRIVFEWALFVAMVEDDGDTDCILKVASATGFGAVECKTRWRPKKSGLVQLSAVMAVFGDLLEKSTLRDSKASLTAIGLGVRTLSDDTDSNKDGME